MSVEDLAPLYLTDVFKAKTKTAVTYLTDRGHGVFLVELLLRTVIEDLWEGHAMPDVGRGALDADEAAWAEGVSSNEIIAIQRRNGSNDEGSEAVDAILGAIDTLIPDIAMATRLRRFASQTPIFRSYDCGWRHDSSY